MQRLVGRVPRQIEDEIDDLAPREHGAALFDARSRHISDGGIDFGTIKEGQLLIGGTKCHMKA